MTKRSRPLRNKRTSVFGLPRRSITSRARTPWQAARLSRLAALEKAIESGFDQDTLLLSDSDLDSLRGEPRFKKLLGYSA